MHCVQMSLKINQIQKMTDLSENRIRQHLQFPIRELITLILSQPRRTVKHYWGIFICMALWAVHLEVVEDMTMDAFLNCLFYFISIHEQVWTIWCDPVSNFVGTKNELEAELNKLDMDMMKNFLLHYNSNFILNISSSNHMGAILERLIGTIKRVLDGSLANPENWLSKSSLQPFSMRQWSLSIVASGWFTISSDLIPLFPDHLLTMKTRSILPLLDDFLKGVVYSRKRCKQIQYMSE